jgi:hypothetical protein
MRPALALVDGEHWIQAARAYQAFMERAPREYDVQIQRARGRIVEAQSKVR